MPKTKLCVIGGGAWGANHIRTLDKLGALGAVVEKKESLLRGLKKQYSHIDFFKSIDESLERDFDGYIVATPAETHFELAKKIINHKKDLLVEKPLTLSIEESQILVKLSKKNNVNLMVGHVLLFHPAIIKIKELIGLGKIGKLQYIYSNRLNLGKVRTEENVFWSLAPHDISIFQYFTDNSFPVKIKASGSAFIQKKIYDSTLTTLEYEQGVNGHIFVSWLHPFKEHRLVVVGSEAMISFEDSKEEKPLTLYSKKIDLVNGVPEKIDGPKELIAYNDKMPLEAELEYFINTKKPLISNGENGLEVVKILVEASKQLDLK